MVWVKARVKVWARSFKVRLSVRIGLRVRARVMTRVKVRAMLWGIASKAVVNKVFRHSQLRVFAVVFFRANARLMLRVSSPGFQVL